MVINFLVSSERFTCLVKVMKHKIIGGAPIVNKWVGKSFHSLLVAWEADKVSVLGVEEDEPIN